MARAGGVLENPATGDRLTFLRTGAETGGEVLEYELRFVPGAFGLRPLFRWNHNWAIKRATEGLEPYAQRKAAA